MSEAADGFDYETLEEYSFGDKKGDNPLQYRISCEDCDWVNRRTMKSSAKKSAQGHERHSDHETTITNDGGPEWAQKEEEEGDDE